MLMSAYVRYGFRCTCASVTRGARWFAQVLGTDPPNGLADSASAEAQIAAFKMSSNGTKRFCIRPARMARMLRLLCFGTVRSFELFRAVRTP
jgi:hypothetical protein